MRALVDGGLDVTPLVGGFALEGGGGGVASLVADDAARTSHAATAPERRGPKGSQQVSSEAGVGVVRAACGRCTRGLWASGAPDSDDTRRYV